MVGAAGAIAVPTLGLETRLGELLSRAVPLPWGSFGIGLLIFLACAGLYFRQQWVRSLARRRLDLERQGAAARLIGNANSDGRRWLRVIQENLELVIEGHQAQRERDLYLEGARAHADKLEQAFERIEGTSKKLENPQP